MIKTALLASCSAALAACAQTSVKTGAGIGVSGNTAAEAPALAGNAWFSDGQKTLAQRKAIRPVAGQAKNVILLVADGMDPTTVAAARIFDGQSKGMEGEEHYLSFETFPYLAMAKTYTVDYQVADSAGTASAIFTGVKTKSGVLSVTDAVERDNCESALAATIPTLGELAAQAGMGVGVVSTARVTHATPAAVYAHSANRDWSVDSAMPEEAKEAGCKDIARQLIEFPYGNGLDLALGGGRAHFMPDTATDPEDADEKGARGDGRDLTAEWAAQSDNHVYVWNKAQFDAAPPDAKILGLFKRGHLQFEADREEDASGEPSLTEMTVKAIELLSRNEEGFFLMVEAARIDHAHHDANAYRALTDTQEFAEAVAAARAMTNERDTLIIATADHGHTMAFQGYPKKGADILGLVGYDASDGKPYTTLVYANGPGSPFFEDDLSDGRSAPDAAEVAGRDYRQQALIPLRSETHGGQDVTIYATGPGAHLFGGVVEQNYIFHVIDDALNLRSRAEIAGR